MFRLILIYAKDPDIEALREYAEREFDSMGALLHYLHSVHEENMYRAIIECVEKST